MSSEIFYVLYRKLAGARSDPTKCLAAVDELAKVCRDSGKAASSVDELLADADNCLHEVAESSILFAAAVSRWLTVDEDVELAKALVHKTNVRHLQQPAAESYDLSNIEETRAILTACRLCTLLAAPAVSLGWTLSLAISYPTSDMTRQTVEHLLQYHVEEFPRTTRLHYRHAFTAILYQLGSSRNTHGPLRQVAILDRWLVRPFPPTKQRGLASELFSSDRKSKRC